MLDRKYWSSTWYSKQTATKNMLSAWRYDLLKLTPSPLENDRGLKLAPNQPFWRVFHFGSLWWLWRRCGTQQCDNQDTRGLRKPFHRFFVIDKSQDAFHGKNLVVIYTEFHQFPLISATRHGYRIFKIRASRIKPRGPDACWEIPGLTKETHWYTDLVL